MTNGCAGTENVADRQEREIDDLRECTQAFEALYACQMLFEKILESLVRQLDSINIDLKSVIDAGYDAATRGIHSDTANRAFARLKERAPAVEWACDLVLESRWEFPRVTGQIGADRLLTVLYEKEWLEQYDRNFPKQ
jgi:hypothetical protein